MKLNEKTKTVALRVMHNTQAQLWCRISEYVREGSELQKSHGMTEEFIRSSISALHAERDEIMVAIRELEKLETEK